jgi:hypothetical protein
MDGLQNKHKRKYNADRYATREDFCRIFSESLDTLYQLSFLMTGDHEKAEKCFLGGLEDSCRANDVFRNWALCWAKRMIIRNAIRELQPRPQGDSSSSASRVLRYRREPPDIRDGHFKTEAVLALEDFERFAFVISVLERYSDRDCAVLLACSPPKVRQARTQAILNIVSSRQTASRRSDEEVAVVIGSFERTLPGIHGNALFSGSSPQASPEPR